MVTLPEKSHEQVEQIKEQLLKRIGEAASKALDKPNGKLNIHYGIVMLDPAAYIEQLIDQCACSTFVFDFDSQNTSLESSVRD